MTSRSWTPRTRIAVLSGTAVTLAALTAWLIPLGTRGAEFANVFALPATLLGLLIASVGHQLRPQVYDSDRLDAEVAGLMRKIHARESKVLQQLLSDTGHAVPADVHFIQPRPVRWRHDGGEESSSLRSIGAFYRSLRFGRLVVLGEAGAGKTVIAIQLVLDLMSETPHRLPLRLNLASFSPNDTLDMWLTNELVTNFRVPRLLASALVEHGRILPVLDGLDEMDGNRPVRASNVLTALNSPTARPFVMTCRTKRYEQLDTVAEDCTVVVAQPLDAHQVIGWLTHRFHDTSQSDGLQRRWRPVINQLNRRPGGALATALSSPLGLFLAATSYRDPSSTPRTLCTLKADDIFSHLLSRLVDAVTAPQNRYSGSAVTRWLRHLAEELRHPDKPGTKAVNLHLERLWLSHVHSETRFRFASTTVNALLIFTPLLAFHGALLSLKGISQQRLSNLMFTIAFCGVLVVIAGLRSGRHQLVHRQFDRTAFDITKLKTHTWWSFLLGAVLATQGLILAGVVVAASLLALLQLVSGFSGSGYNSTGLARTVKSGWIYDITVIAACGAFMDAYKASYMMSKEGSLPGLWDTVGFFLLGVSIGFVIRARSPWPRYLVHVRCSSRRGTAPPDLARFLDWAVDAGLLRMAGSAVQFRHIEFQDWLLKPSSATLSSSWIAPVSATGR